MINVENVVILALSTYRCNHEDVIKLKIFIRVVDLPDVLKERGVVVVCLARDGSAESHGPVCAFDRFYIDAGQYQSIVSDTAKSDDACLGEERQE